MKLLAEGWETEYASRHMALMLWALVRSVIAARPVTNPSEYYQAIAQGIVAYLRTRRLEPIETYLTRDVWVRFGGFEYLLTPQTLFAYYLHAFEPLTSADLAKQNGDLFVDIGANVGQYSLPLSHHFKRVIAVEPNPIAADVLMANLVRNHITNVEVIRRAIAPQRGSCRLFAGKVLTTWGCLTESSKFVDVEAIRLDDLLDGLRSVDVLKLDIEGLEAAVLMESVQLHKARRISFAAFEEDLPGLSHRFANLGFRILRRSRFFGSDENYVAVRREPTDFLGPLAVQATDRSLQSHENTVAGPRPAEL